MYRRHIKVPVRIYINTHTHTDPVGIYLGECLGLAYIPQLLYILQVCLQVRIWSKVSWGPTCLCNSMVIHASLSYGHGR